MHDPLSVGVGPGIKKGRHFYDCYMAKEKGFYRYNQDWKWSNLTNWRSLKRDWDPFPSRDLTAGPERVNCQVVRRPLRGPCGKEASGLQELKTNRKWGGSPTTTSKYAQPQNTEKVAESSPGKECRPVNTLLQPCDTLRKEQAKPWLDSSPWKLWKKKCPLFETSEFAVLTA